jgi:flagella basal body P-ring formation protein FlgA
MQKDLTSQNAVETDETSYGTIGERVAEAKINAENSKEKDFARLTPLQKAINLAEEEVSAKNAPAVEAKVAPLAHWKSDEKAFFESLAPQAQKKVLDMYKGIQTVYEKKTLETAEKQKRYESFDNVFKPYENIFSGRNIDKVAYIKKMLEMDKFASSNPVEFARNFVSARKISPNDLFNASQSAQAQPVQYISALERKIAALENALGAQKLEQSASHIEAVRNKKDEAGNLKYPHIDALTPDMVKLSSLTGSTDLDELYTKALWLNEDFRTQMIEAEKQKAIDEQAKKAEVSRIKNAKDFNIRPVYSGSSGVTSKKSLRDIIEEAEQEIG